MGRGLPSSFVPTEDQGYFFLNFQLPPAASLQRTDEVGRKVEEILTKTEGVRYLTNVEGFSLLARVSASYNGFAFVALKPWDERGSPGSRPARSCAGSTPASPRRSRTPTCSASCPRPFPAWAPPAASPSGCRTAAAASPSTWPGTSQAFLAAARKRPELHGRHLAVQHQHAPALRRRGPGQGAQAGRAGGRRLPDPAGLPGRALPEPVQPLRPAVAGLPAGRGRGPHQRGRHRPVPRAQQGRRHGAPFRPGDRPAHPGARVHQPLQPDPRRPGAGPGRPGLQLRPGPDGPGAGGQAGAARRT